MVVKDVMLTVAHWARVNKHLDTVKQQVRDAPGGREKIVYVDEVVFTFNTDLKLEYSNRYENIIQDKQKSSMKCMAAIAAISARKGLIYVKLHEKSVDRWKFIEYVNTLSMIFENERFTLFLDNLGAHHALETKDCYKKCRLNVIFNAAY